MLALNVEEAQAHTRILRVMLAVDDCVAYWKAPTDDVAPASRARIAFEERWFGAKSEARVRTLLGDMEFRFERYPEALAALRAWQPPREIAPWICHFHTQLADPIYRAFSGDFLPLRRNQGYATVDREAVARWVQERSPGKWSASTCMKFGGNMLSAAWEAGLLRDRKDPRKLVTPRVPKLALGYLLYLLRHVSVDGGLLESPYLASVLPEASVRSSELRGIDGVRVSVMGDVQNFEWAYPDLMSWARAQAAGGRTEQLREASA
jgi:hypothetical protein